MDPYRTLQMLLSKTDGESPVRHRSAVVAVVNGDRTVNLTMGGLTVANVSTLGGFFSVGEVVQVIAWAGDLLVLGVAGLSSGFRLLGYTENTADHDGFSTTPADIANLTLPSITFPANRRIRLVGQCQTEQNTALGHQQILIREGGTQLQGSTQTVVAGGFTLHHLERIFTPSVGAHTYKMMGAVQAGGTMDILGSAGLVAFLSCEDIGPI